MKILKFIFNYFIKILPYNNLGDKIFSLIFFLKTFRRFPNNKKLLSNYLFKLKNSSEAYNPLRAYISDKEFVKDYVKSKLDKDYTVPTIRVFSKINNIKNFEFPLCCCIKPSHLSGSIIMRENGEKIDFAKIEKWLKTNYYELKREKNYRYLKPKIIVEPLIYNKTNNLDYKFFCFKGKAKFVQIDIDRKTNHTRLYLDRDWNEQEFSIKYKKSSKKIYKPSNFKSMLNVADTLSNDFEFMRIDLYTDGKKIYVGEITNFPDSGNGYFIPNNTEEIVSKLLFDEI